MFQARQVSNSQNSLFGTSNLVGVTLAKRSTVGQRGSGTCLWGHESEACESCMDHRWLKITTKCHNN